MESTRFEIERMGLITTHRCTLACKLCGAFSPYYSPIPHWSAKQLIVYVDRLFEFVDYLGKFSLHGGEPFTHPELDSLIKHINHYSDKIGILEFITNGTIIPSDSVLHNMQLCGKVKVIIDDYGPNLSKAVKELEQALERYNIFYETRKYYGEDAYYNGWIDMSDISYKNRNKEEDIQIYQECIFSGKFKCLLLVGGRIYPCATASRCDNLNILHQKSDYLDIMNEEFTIEDKRQKLRNFFEKSCFEACSYCVGFNDKAQRYCAAEQLEKRK